MAQQPTGTLAVILHADVVGSTLLVQRDERRAHERITGAFQRLSQTIQDYGGQVHEIRGDALLAEFQRASDAVCAALAFQQANSDYNETLDDDIVPEVRIGISLGEVVIADNTVTGAGVVLAQRVEQLAEPGGLCVTEAIREATPGRLALDVRNLGAQELKGFEQPVHVHAVRLQPDAEVPAPEPQPVPKRQRPRILAVAVAAAFVLTIALVWLEPWQPDTTPASVDKMVHALPSEPSIAVLPFNNLSGDREQDYLADGFTAEIITSLSQTPNLFVIARSSMDTYKGKAVSVKQVAEEQGVHYVLEGSIQSTGDRIRVKAQLIDALEGNHLWAESYDRDLQDLFTIQDEIAHNIAVEMQVKLIGGDLVRRRAEGLDPEAYRLAYKGDWHMDKFDKENMAKSRELFLQARAISPDALFPLVMLGWVDAHQARYGWSPSREESLRSAEAIARQVLAKDDSYTEAIMLMGMTRSLRRELDEAIRYYEKAIETNPNHANAVGVLGLTLAYAGRPEEAIAALKKAMRLSPFYPMWMDAAIGLPYMMTGQYGEAIEAYEAVLAKNELVLFSHERLAAINALKGDLEMARVHAAKVLEIKPDFSIEGWSKVFLYTHRSDLDRELGALRKAGLPEKPPLNLPDKPSIAVLPFDNLSGDKEQDPIADGLTEDIITSLSRVPNLFVIARNSTFTYKGKPVKVQQVARDLGVRYVLEGSVQRSGDRLRVTAQLVDALDESHLWADRYDRLAENLFDLQDEITRKVLVELQVKLTLGEHARVSSQSTNSLEAWLLRNQAYAEGLKFSKNGMLKARELYRAAVHADPTYSRGLGGIAWTYWWEARMGGWQSSRDEALEKATGFAESAIEADPKEPVGYMQMALISLLKSEHDRAIGFVEHATELAPGDFQSTASLAYQLVWVGEAQRALETFARAKRLSPRYPSWILGMEGLAQHMLGRHEKAIVAFNEQLERNPRAPFARARLTAIYADLDRLEEAKVASTDLLEMKPDFTVERFLKTQPFKASERKEWVRNLLLKAGLPE